MKVGLSPPRGDGKAVFSPVQRTLLIIKVCTEEEEETGACYRIEAEMMFYEEILRVLQKHEVHYLILGGAAVNLHGVPRMTADLDITIDLSAENVAATVEALTEAGMKVSLPLDPLGLADSELRREWRQDKQLEALTFQSPGSGAPYREVDVVIEPPLDFEAMYEARTVLEIDDLRVALVSLPHLIEIKTRLGREQDLADVNALKKIDSVEGEPDA